MATGDLLQSEGWERFQQALGRTTHRVGGALAIATELPFGGTYLACPRVALAPVDAETIARATGAVFVRHEGAGITPRVLRHIVEPEHTWRVSLVPSLDDLIASMHEKHRYNIRLARRRGVSIRMHAPPTSSRGGVGGGGIEANDFDACWSLLQETAHRQRIQTHPRAYYTTMLATLPDVRVYLAERDGATLAAAIVATHGDTATYLHGGSSYAHRADMAPHLLHWMAMGDAKRAGCAWYDFGGVSPSWEGITRFKQGFGGEDVPHPPTQDLVVRRPWYTVLAALARLRR